MIPRSFKNTAILIITTAMVTVLAASCSSSDSTTTTSGITFDLSAVVAPAVPGNVSTPNPGEKQFTTAAGDTVTLTRAYLVLSSVEIVTSCTNYTRVLDTIFDTLIPPALAHTTPTPTTTGIPYVIDLMASDGTGFTLGQLAPPPGDYCGANLFMDPADSDTRNLPTTFDMVGRSLYLEGSYVLSGGTASNPITVSIDVPLLERNLLFPTVVSVSATNLNGSASTTINYDTWFDKVLPVDLDGLASGSATEIDSFLLNVTFSLVQ